MHCSKCLGAAGVGAVCVGVVCMLCPHVGVVLLLHAHDLFWVRETGTWRCLMVAGVSATVCVVLSRVLVSCEGV